MKQIIRSQCDYKFNESFVYNRLMCLKYSTLFKNYSLVSPQVYDGFFQIINLSKVKYPSIDSGWIFAQPVMFSIYTIAIRGMLVIVSIILLLNHSV